MALSDKEFLRRLRLGGVGKTAAAAILEKSPSGWPRTTFRYAPFGTPKLQRFDEDTTTIDPGDDTGADWIRFSNNADLFLASDRAVQGDLYGVNQSSTTAKGIFTSQDGFGGGSVWVPPDEQNHASIFIPGCPSFWEYGYKDWVLDPDGLVVEPGWQAFGLLFSGVGATANDHIDLWLA